MRATVGELQQRNQKVINKYKLWNLRLELQNSGVCEKCPYALALCGGDYI